VQIRLVREELATERHRLAGGEQISLLGNILRIAVVADAAGEVTLELKYAVTGTSWRPTYTLRVSTETNKVEVGYKAVIMQETGEVCNIIDKIRSL
jgi:hypothetical protein